jgi:hypothetical protein
MNHCIIGGVGDGDSGEDDGDEQREARAAVAVARGTPPASWGSAAPYPPSFMALWDPSPMEMRSMGEAKMWLWWLQIRGWRCPPRIRFPPLI